MASRRSSGLSGGAARGAPPRLYTAQDVADFCEVDLKTVHHWVDRGKVPHHRTEGRHLRFRRNDVVRFLRAHGYPLPGALTRARPVVALALTEAPAGSPLSLDELAKRLASRFSPRRYPGAVAALAHLVADAPDVLVLSTDDVSVSVSRVVAALKAAPETAWIAVAAVGGDLEAALAAKSAGAEVALVGTDSARLAPELARALAVA